MESYIYTEKEEKMHVTGDYESVNTQCLFASTEFVHSSKLSSSQIKSFIDHGFFIAQNQVDQSLFRSARRYINSHYNNWLKQSRRQDDWRIHYQLHFSSLNQPVEHAPILDIVLQSPRLLQSICALLKSPPGGIFYNQVAYRTPLPHNCSSKILDYTPGAEYHIDGQANAYGTRFPDPWSVLVGIALVDLDREDMGNFTIFPGAHYHNWCHYPQEKRDKTLPDLGTPYRVCLKAGDAVFCHVLLPHRGGKNTVLKTEHIDREQALPTQDLQQWIGIDYTELSQIPRGTREMIFFRIQRALPPDSPAFSLNITQDGAIFQDPNNVAYYYSSERSRRILEERDLFFEYPGLFDDQQDRKQEILQDSKLTDSTVAEEFMDPIIAKDGVNGI
jgi:hypothetical protein